MSLDPAECTVTQAAFRFGLIYWGGVFLVSAALRAAGVSEPVLAMLGGKLVRSVLCWLISVGIAAVLFQLHERYKVRSNGASLPLLVVASFILSLVGAPLLPLLRHGLQLASQWPAPMIFESSEFRVDLAVGAALFFGWSCLFVTLLYSFEIHDRERRLNAMREEALGAQMRALRYQVNPHFLFNTLNSVAGLIEEGDSTRAGKMLMALSDFLRTTLSIDPMHDVPLSHELALQSGYLAIERERFPDRMAVEIDVPEAARDALVPSLILQPLIENAIKHGVNAAKGRVHIALTARREADRLHLMVENDMPTETAGGAKPPGMGVGLRNVAERLRTRFADNSGFSSGEVRPGRYRVAIDLPWRLA